MNAMKKNTDFGNLDHLHL